MSSIQQGRDRPVTPATARPADAPASAAPAPDMSAPVAPGAAAVPASLATRPAELGGPKGLEPTRYGDWERDGRCVDF
jgi:hypothetical protein